MEKNNHSEEEIEYLLNYYLLQYDEIVKREQEYMLVKDIINNITPTEDSWINIYNFIFVKGNIKDTNTFLVHIGGNTFMEKTKDELLKDIDNSLKEINNLKQKIKEEIEKLYNLDKGHS